MNLSSLDKFHSPNLHAILDQNVVSNGEETFFYAPPPNDVDVVCWPISTVGDNHLPALRKEKSLPKFFDITSCPSRNV